MFERPLGSDERLDHSDSSLPPLDDPYLCGRAPAPRAELSKLAVTSVLSALLLGPFGAIAAIVFGWAARREIEAAGSRRRGQGLATAGLALGVALTMGWGAALTFFTWIYRYGEDQPVASAAETPAREVEPADRPVEPAPASTSEPRPSTIAPKNTTETREGGIALVDVGASATSLSEEFATQRKKASGAGEALIVMTTRGGCEPCRSMDATLRDPLMQTALAKVRLVRVDVELFHEDLQGLKIPHSKIPGFFLLAPDLSPRDGIDGGEWDDDVAANIAPVLGSFIRGRYTTRREPWRPLPGSGMRL